MIYSESVSVATGVGQEHNPRAFLKGLCGSYHDLTRADYCPAKGQPLQESSGVFAFLALTLEGCSCVLCLDLGPSESGKMKSEPQARRSSQRGLDPGTGGCVSQPIRVPLDRACSVSHAVTDAVRGLTSITRLGWASYARNPATRINNHDTL